MDRAWRRAEGCEGLRMKIQPLVIPGLFGHVQLRAFPPQAWPHGLWRELVSLHPSLMPALRTALHPQFGAVEEGRPVPGHSGGQPRNQRRKYPGFPLWTPLGGGSCWA